MRRVFFAIQKIREGAFSSGEIENKERNRRKKRRTYDLFERGKPNVRLKKQPKMTVWTYLHRTRKVRKEQPETATTRMI